MTGGITHLPTGVNHQVDKQKSGALARQSIGPCVDDIPEQIQW